MQRIEKVSPLECSYQIDLVINDKRQTLYAPSYQDAEELANALLTLPYASVSTWERTGKTWKTFRAVETLSAYAQYPASIREPRNGWGEP